MKKTWLILGLSFAFFALGVLAARFYFKPNIDRSAPWHPFELNSNIDLISLVESGYRCTAMPCGQPQFCKTLGDTMIQYEVFNFDCLKQRSYTKGSFMDSAEVDSNLLPASKVLKSTSGLDAEKNAQKENPYYPYEFDEIKNCFIEIDYRVFEVCMNEIDSNWIVDYVTKNDAYILEEFQNWSVASGGSFMVYHKNSKLYFHCSLDRTDNNFGFSNKNWTFTIIRSIPNLSQDQELEKQREMSQIR